MKLIDNPLSPYAMKVRIALYEKGLDVEKREIHFHGDRDALFGANPRGEVPALQDGDTTIYDSRVILDYLEDRHPTPALLPSSPADRARCRTLENLCDTQMDSCVIVIGTIKIFRPDMEATHAEALAKGAEILERHHANLDRELAGREYLVGDFSRADIALAPHLGFTAFMGYPIDAGKYGNLAAWFDRVNQRPSIQQATQEAMGALEKSQNPPAGEQPLFDPQRLHWRSDRIEALLRVGLGPWLLEELKADRGFLPPLP